VQNRSAKRGRTAGVAHQEGTPGVHSSSAACNMHSRRAQQEGTAGGHSRRAQQEGSAGGVSRRVQQEGSAGGVSRRGQQEGAVKGHSRRAKHDCTASFVAVN
jgi:hypothetical protein